MDTLALALARWQFAILTVIHFFFVPLTLGMTILLAILETFYVKTGDEVYKKMVKFWSKVFLINFALGVVSGIVQEFQFGMNWSEYSRFMGDIFGAPLAIEALLAFYLESTFIGIWVFGWDRLSPKLHAAVMWLVAIGSNLSALWILVANSFMQEPVGYVLRNGRAEMESFAALVKNPNVWVQFPHVLSAGISTAGFVVLGLSAVLILRGKREAWVMRSFKVGALWGLIGVILVITFGHSQAQHIARVQPMKLAAAEAHWETENPAAYTLIAIANQDEMKNSFEIRIPTLLSWLVYDRPTGEVKGIREMQAIYEEKYGPDNYIPPVNLLFYSFHLMVLAGLLMLVFAIYALYLDKKGLVAEKPGFLKWLVWGIALPYIASSTGWIMTEIGRQPWIVFTLQKVCDAVSPAVSSGEVLFSLIALTLIYILITGAGIYLVLRHLEQGQPEPSGAGY